MKILKNIFTGKDNETFDIGRILWAIGVIAMIIFTGYHVYTKGEFDAMSYGTGLGGLLGGGGIGVGMKSKAEPE